MENFLVIIIAITFHVKFFRIFATLLLGGLGIVYQTLTTYIYEVMTNCTYVASFIIGGEATL
jgi:hypothetical protein